MRWTVLTIRKAFGGRLVGTPFMKKMVCKATLLLPSDIIEIVTKRVWIVSSTDDAWAMTFRGDELTERHLVFLSEDLLRQEEQQIFYTYLHEIGHVILEHRNAIRSEQTETQIKQQEIEADRFAKKYLK